MRGALLLKLPSDDAKADTELVSILLPRSGMSSSWWCKRFGFFRVFVQLKMGLI